MKPTPQKSQPPSSHNPPTPIQIQDGFSGDEQQQQQFLYSMPQNIDQYLDQAYTHTKLKLQPTQDIIKKSYSLQPDMINGWIPKIMLAKPIPLKFNNYGFDQMIQYAFKRNIINKGYTKHKSQSQKQENTQTKQQQNIQLVYMGPRYQTTYYAWYDKQIQFPYKHLNAPKNIKITDRFLVGQHWNAQKQNILNFDSIFESGNLDCVFKVGQNQYDLFIRVDSNTKGHLQWYNFKIKNIIPRKIYKINICNFQKGKSLYTRGMRPYCYSLKKYQNQHIQWHQIKGQVKYRKKVCKTYKKLQIQQSNKLLTLTYQFSTQYQNDCIQFAYCIPYTYSYLKKYLSNLYQNNKNRNILSIKKLCTSLGGHPIDQLTITQNVNQQQQSYKSKQKLKNKKIIFITGRCHPGQTNGSWMVEGLINYLCSYSDACLKLRQNIIFKIIPMLNPDGVIIGNYRTGLFGKDFNRQFHYPDKDIFPQIYYLKEMFWAYKSIYQQNAFIYLDFHGHSIKKNVFAYGPQYPINHKNYYQSRLIPKLISLKSNMFRYHSCIFKISQSKQSTGRAIFLKSHKIPYTFTIQASNGSYFDQELKQNVDFNDQKWKLVGEKVLEGIHDYIKLVLQLEKIREQKFRERKQMLMRNRQRTKTKKNKNSRLGYSTSMGFRKAKTFQDEENYDNEKQKLNMNKVSFSLNDMIGGMKNMLDGQKFSSILDEIKNQQNKNETEQNDKKQSDDQISQGKSDSQGEEDDLDQSQRNQLMQMIKQNRYKFKVKSKNTSRLSKKHKDPQQNFQIKTMCDVGHGQNQETQEQKQQRVQKQNSKKSTKQIMMKKYLWKKKNSAFSSVSPKKQDQVAAKIVNFNFSLNPMQCTNKNQSNLNSCPSNPSSTGYQAHNSAYCTTYYTLKSSNAYLTNITINNKQQKVLKINQHQAHPKKFGARAIQYSDTFKKTFMSVQKQMLRRDSYKRYLVSVNNQVKNNNKNIGGNSGNSGNVGLDNVKGKKIGSVDHQELQIPAQEIQLMRQQRYSQMDKLQQQERKYIESVTQSNFQINLHSQPHTTHPHPHSYINSQKRKQIKSPPYKVKQKIVNRIYHKNKLKIDLSKSKKQIKPLVQSQIQQKTQKQPQKQRIFIQDKDGIQQYNKVNYYEEESHSPLTIDSPLKKNFVSLDSGENKIKTFQSLPIIQ